MSDGTQTVVTDDAAELFRLRMQLGATQAEVGCMLGVSRSAISHWERGDNPVQPWALHRLRIIYSMLAKERQCASDDLLALRRANEALCEQMHELTTTLQEAQAEIERLREGPASLAAAVGGLDAEACRRWLINATCKRVAEWAEGAAPPVSQMREALEVLRMAEGER